MLSIKSKEASENKSSNSTSNLRSPMPRGLGCVTLMWNYECGCRWMWLKALMNLRRGRPRMVHNKRRRHSLLDFMRLQHHSFVNTLPLVFFSGMVSMSYYHM